jgi:hypothetical protein
MPSWVLGCDSPYLPATFFSLDPDLPDSYQSLLDWLDHQPWSEGGRLSRGGVQQILLAIGLALRALDMVIFDEPDGSNHPDDYPAYMASCPWRIEERHKLDERLNLLWIWLQKR